MSVRILSGIADGTTEGAAIYCGSTGVALACPLFDSHEQAERFLDHCTRVLVDPRKMTPGQLSASAFSYCTSIEEGLAARGDHHAV